MRPKAEVQMEELAIFIHGALFSFHMLGVLYNLRRGNRFDVLAHVLAAAYDANAMHHHIVSLEDLS